MKMKRFSHGEKVAAFRLFLIRNKNKYINKYKREKKFVSKKELLVSHVAPLQRLSNRVIGDYIYDTGLKWAVKRPFRLKQT